MSNSRIYKYVIESIQKRTSGIKFGFYALHFVYSGGDVPPNTTVVTLNICDNEATCFDCTESSSGPRVLDLYKECTMHCGIPNVYNNRSKVQQIQYTIQNTCKLDCLCEAKHKK
jgi:hypothetical protein